MKNLNIWLKFEIIEYSNHDNLFATSTLGHIKWIQNLQIKYLFSKYKTPERRSHSNFCLLKTHATGISQGVALIIRVDL